MRSLSFSFSIYLAHAVVVSRHINRCFFFIVCLQLISVITPVSPLTTWGPLLVIFGISATKEALDDVSNSRRYETCSGVHWESVSSWQIHVGDLVRLSDLCVLSSSDECGLLFLQTSNWDGETNLKKRRALAERQRVFGRPTAGVCAAECGHLLFRLDAAPDGAGAAVANVGGAAGSPKALLCATRSGWWGWRCTRAEQARPAREVDAHGPAGQLLLGSDLRVASLFSSSSLGRSATRCGSYSCRSCRPCETTCWIMSGPRSW